MQHTTPGHPPHHPSDLRVAWILVGIQTVLFLTIALGAFWAGVGPELPHSRIAGLALVTLGSVGLLASAGHLGDALTPLPLPNQTGIVVHGAYRWVRHPIYTAVILVALGVAVSSGAIISYVGLVLLVVLFEYKSRMEEGHLLSSYADYAGYAARTGKFVPGLARLRS